MPFYRRRRTKRGQRPKTARRPYTIGRPKRKYNMPTYRFKRTNEFFTILSSNAGIQSAGFAFQLDDLPSYTEFTALFDQYRIRGVKLDLFFNQSAADSNNPVGSGLFCHFIDLDDATAPASEAEVCQRGYLKKTSPFGHHKIFIRPRTSKALWQGAFTAYGQNNSNQWIDCTYPAVEYYGWKYLWTQTTVANLRLMVSATYYLEFRASR